MRTPRRSSACAPAERCRCRGSRARPRRAGCSASRRSPAFPSSVGGAVVMNAGCYGVEIKDVLVSATALHRDGRRQRYAVDDLEAVLSQDRAPGRRSGGGDRDVPAPPRRRRPRRSPASRSSTASAGRACPSGLPNAGSIFRNPAGDHAGRLIEAAGLKGRRCGGARDQPEARQRHRQPRRRRAPTTCWR